MDVKRLVAKRIRVARAEKDISQVQLAQMLTLDQTAISKWESGAVSIGVDTLARIAAALGKPITYFFQEFDDAASEASAETRNEARGATRPKARSRRQAKR